MGGMLKTLYTFSKYHQILEERIQHSILDGIVLEFIINSKVLLLAPSTLGGLRFITTSSLPLGDFIICSYTIHIHKL